MAGADRINIMRFHQFEVFLQLFPGRTVGAPVRVLKNRMSREYVRQEKAGADKMELEKYTLGSLRRAVFEGDTTTGSLMAGQVAGMLHEVRPVADILNDLWEGGRQRIAALNELC